MRKNLFPHGKKEVLIAFDQEFYKLLEEYAKRIKGLGIVAYIRSVIMNSLSPEFCAMLNSAEFFQSSGTKSFNGRNLPTTRKLWNQWFQNMNLTPIQLESLGATIKEQLESCRKEGVCAEEEDEDDQFLPFYEGDKWSCRK